MIVATSPARRPGPARPAVVGDLSPGAGELGQAVDPPDLGQPGSLPGTPAMICGVLVRLGDDGAGPESLMIHSTCSADDVS